MGNKEMIDFLKQEKWHMKYLGERLIKVIDPVLGDGYYIQSLKTPFRIASRRKAAHDRAKLKKAGFFFHRGDWCKIDSGDVETHSVYSNRAEALATLKGNPGVSPEARS